MDVSKMVKNLGGFISENSPTILTGLAVGGLITTSILAVKATPKAIQLIESEQKRRRDECREFRVSYGDLEELSKWDIIRTTWTCYIPAGAIGIASILCIIGANTIHLRRNAAIASLYTITETAFKEYQAKVVETIGKNKELKVRDDIAADHIKANPSGSNEVIFTGKGEVLCYDSLSGRYFKSDIEHIRSSVNELNRSLLSEMWLSLNELYYVLGLGETKLGEQLGWDLDKGLLSISFSAQVSDGGEPCLVLNYDVSPRFMP